MLDPGYPSRTARHIDDVLPAKTKETVHQKVELMYERSLRALDLHPSVVTVVIPPEEATISVDICSDTRVAGSVFLTKLFAEWLVREGYQNVFIKGASSVELVPVLEGYTAVDTVPPWETPNTLECKKVNIHLNILPPKALLTPEQVQAGSISKQQDGTS